MRQPKDIIQIVYKNNMNWILELTLLFIHFNFELLGTFMMFYNVDGFNEVFLHLLKLKKQRLIYIF